MPGPGGPGHRGGLRVAGGQSRGRPDPGGRRQAVVVGRRPVLEAVRSGAAREVLVAIGSRSTPGLREVVEAAGASGVAIRQVQEERVESLTDEGPHQGVAAVVVAPKPLAEADLRGLDWGPEAVAVILDGVTDPRNIGAVARTAEAAGAEALVVRRRRGAGWSQSAMRTSAGALLHLPVAEVGNLSRALGALKGNGFWVVGLEASAPLPIHEADRPPGRVAMVLGSEGKGLSRLTRESCDELVRIDLRGRVASLNVSVAAGIGLFAYAAGEGRGARQEFPG
jgi:23S rRNA (guanosine2251-2'-O)-methyltransferase